ncbi:MAG: DNA primase, partial [Clostridia bacterium]|nr:DNA primase [Clostridia bacterium]
MARRISDEFRQELLDKTDIVDLISRYVPLKKKGNTYWACCPFHKEKTASLNVNMQKQLYYCFGCHKGGNAITFVKEIENMTYPDAVQLLADLAGMTIPDDSGFGNDEEREKRRKRHYEICKEAAKYFFSVLSEGENAAKAYCSKRGLIPAVIKRFGIGYAKGDGGLLKHLNKLGFTEEEMLESCLAKKDKTGKLREFFFERLMFPIIDVYGNFIAFGGRVIGEGEPKYLNSSDSEFYNKKRHLYGLNIVKKQKTASRLILVEGYMDVVAVSSYGLQGAVASLGTAFTKEQCMLIKRFTQNVFIAYDGDKAGQNAAVR